MGRAAPRPHLGRLALLALVLIGASFYISPLRSFFQQQDRYNKAAAQLQAARQDNTALAAEADLLITKAYIAQRARSDSMLVPPGTQVFVIKGLPGKEAGAELQHGHAADRVFHVRSRSHRRPVAHPAPLRRA